MKIYIPIGAQAGIGGGWRFTTQLMKALDDKVEFVDQLELCDLFFIPGPTLADRDEVVLAKKLHKKIVLRVDNIVKNSRNRGTGTTRLYEFAKMADKVIYQSKFARDWLKDFLGEDGEVILNGTDISVFNETGEALIPNGTPQYIFCRARRDDDKRWSKAWYEFQKIYFKNPKAHLWIVGNFGRDSIKYNFDFYSGAEKRYKFFGIIERAEDMAKIFRGADVFIYSYTLDACSNSLIEARMCGNEILRCDNGDSGADEIMATSKEELTMESVANKYLKVFEKVCQ